MVLRGLRYGEPLEIWGDDLRAHENELYVNLFIPSQLQWKEQGTEIVQRIISYEPSTRIMVNPTKAKKFTLLLREPIG